MKCDKRSLDYQLNILMLQEMERDVPMTLPERRRLQGWVMKGHSVDSNPWNYNETPMDIHLISCRLSGSGMGITAVPGTTGKGRKHRSFGTKSTSVSGIGTISDPVRICESSMAGNP